MECSEAPEVSRESFVSVKTKVEDSRVWQRPRRGYPHACRSQHGLNVSTARVLEYSESLCLAC